MNIEEKRYFKSRLLSTFLLLLSLGGSVFSLVTIIMNNPDNIILMYIALILCMSFNVFEIVFILKRYKKESALQSIAFNENGTINNVPLIAVGVGTVLAVGLLTLSLVVYFVRGEISIKCDMMIILSIAGYLFANCLVYYFYLLFFKKREINLRDFIK